MRADDIITVMFWGAVFLAALMWWAAVCWRSSQDDD